MVYPADLTDSEYGDEVDFDDYEYYSEDTPDEDYFIWRRPDPTQFIQKLQELLSDYPDGLALRDFLEAFGKKHRESLDLESYGCKTLTGLLMDYSDVLKCIREGTDPDGWLAVDASRPPTEMEKTTLSMQLNPELVEEVNSKIKKIVTLYISQKQHRFRLGVPIDVVNALYKEMHDCFITFDALGFNSLEAYCLANSRKHFLMCGLKGSYALLPPMGTWRCPEPLPEAPLPPMPLLQMGKPEVGKPEIPKYMVGPDESFFEIDYRRYLEPGQRVQIRISHYVDPLNFYFVLQGFDTVRHDFQNALETFYDESNDLLIPKELIKPGVCCAVLYSNSELHDCGDSRYIWGRARVIEVINEDTVRVILVDTGESVEIRTFCIRFLARQFLGLPVHIIPGMLAGVAPENKTTGKFDRLSMLKFIEYSREPHLEAEIHSPDFNRPIFPVIVFASYSLKSLNQILIDSFHNRHLTQVSYCILTRKSFDDKGSIQPSVDEIHPFSNIQWTLRESNEHYRNRGRGHLSYKKTDRKRGSTNHSVESHTELPLASSSVRRQATTAQSTSCSARDPVESTKSKSSPASSPTDSHQYHPKSKFLIALESEIRDKFFMTPLQYSSLNKSQAQKGYPTITNVEENWDDVSEHGGMQKHDPTNTTVEENWDDVSEHGGMQKHDPTNTTVEENWDDVSEHEGMQKHNPTNTTVKENWDDVSEHGGMQKHDPTNTTVKENWDDVSEHGGMQKHNPTNTTVEENWDDVSEHGGMQKHDPTNTTVEENWDDVSEHGGMQKHNPTNTTVEENWDDVSEHGGMQKHNPTNTTVEENWDDVSKHEEIQSSKTVEKEAKCQNLVTRKYLGDMIKTEDQEPMEKLINTEGKNKKDVKPRRKPKWKNKTSKPWKPSEYESQNIYDPWGPSTSKQAAAAEVHASTYYQKSGNKCHNDYFLSAPSTSKQASAAEAYASTRYRNFKGSKAWKKGKPELKDESKFNIDNDTTSDSAANTKTKTNSDTNIKTDFNCETDPGIKRETETEQSSDASDSSKGSSDLDTLYIRSGANDKDLDEYEHQEINRCIMSLLSSNNILRDVGLINPQKALDIAKIWAQSSRFTETLELFSSEDFNPFEVYPKSQQQSPIFRLLTDSIPEEVFRKWEEYSNAVAKVKPEFQLIKMKKFREYRVKADRYLDELETIKSTSKSVEPRQAEIIIQKLHVKQKRRYRVMIENWVYKCTRNDLKILRRLKLFEGLDMFLKRGRFHIKWQVTKTEQAFILKEFERIFSVYIASRKHLVEVGEKIDNSGKIVVMNEKESIRPMRKG